MGEVVNILKNQPHMEGLCVCLGCKYSWYAVMPAGSVALTCPNCNLDKGVLQGTVHPEEFWQCDCGCVHFLISADMSTICAHCGLAQEF